ncbi:MAG: M23 family metallopeptidase [Proteobacteria bacterium]|nr:M23 family metallopeptidase [Pseudomonadota bacterium]
MSLQVVAAGLMAFWGGKVAQGQALASLDAPWNGQLHAIADRLDELEDELDTVETSIAVGERRLRSNARTLSRLDRAGMLPMAGGVAAMLGHTSRLERLRRVVQADLAGLTSLQTQRRALVRSREALGRSHEGIASGVLQQRRRAHGRAAPPELTARPSGRAPGSRASRFAVSGAAAHSAVSSGGRTFGARHRHPLFGMLAMPVKTPARIRDASRPDSEGPGLEFLAPGGADVLAAASGSVAFSDVYAGYGRLIILDHGEGLYTVYGGLRHVGVEVGDEVGARARLGSVGRKGQAAVLFFAVRQGAAALPPRGWLEPEASVSGWLTKD